MRWRPRRPVGAGPSLHKDGRSREGGHFSIIWGQELCTVLAVAVEHPDGQEERGALVALAEGLGPGDPVSDDGRGGDRALRPGC